MPSFGEVREQLCERCGCQVCYRGGNWTCEMCGWTTARDNEAGRLTLEHCPKCGESIVYNGNYFCEDLFNGCDWALPHPARKKADRALVLRLTGETS